MKNKIDMLWDIGAFILIAIGISVDLHIVVKVILIIMAFLYMLNNLLD